MIPIKLKLKYRNPDSRLTVTKQFGEPSLGTLTWRGDKNRPNPGSAGNGRMVGCKSKKSPTQGNGIRRKSYGPW